jgi:2-phospho-L-lactate guanylyltransferase (CobY/MobA/RfbA family)
VTRRFVAVVTPARASGDERLAAAMLEDVVDMVAGMREVEGAIVTAPAWAELAESVRWPDMPLVVVDEAADVGVALDALRQVGADEAAVVAGDVPDLPPLLLGKLFSALASRDPESEEVALCPAEDGGLCGVATRLPVPKWFRALGVSFEASDALERVRAAAPARACHVGAGWHRVRDPGDIGLLDPSLEGWEATRALLGR